MTSQGRPAATPPSGADSPSQEGRSGELPGIHLDGDSLRAAAADLRRIEACFADAQRRLREMLLEGSSADRRVGVTVTGDGLAVSVRIDPDAMALGAPSLERSVLEAMNEAALGLQRVTSAELEQAAARVAAEASGATYPSGSPAAGSELDGSR